MTEYYDDDDQNFDKMTAGMNSAAILLSIAAFSAIVCLTATVIYFGAKICL